MEVTGKVSVILFTTFFDANTTREFLQNNSNFKESEKNNFVARWYKLDDENLVSESLRKKITKYTNKFLEQHLKKMNIMGNMGKNLNMNGNQMNSYSPMNNMNMQYNSGNNFNNNNTLQYKGGLNTNNTINGNESMEGFRNLNKNNQNLYSSPQLNGMNNNFNSQLQNKKFEDNSNINGKFTCRFEIQIENDKDFQVARRLIGSKVNI